MDPYTNHELIEKAKTVLKPRTLPSGDVVCDVACALVSASGKIYLGVCFSAGSDGHCAEVAAIAAMITAGETSIAQIVAVWGEDTVLPPCGRCREFMYQVDKTNLTNTDVVLGASSTVKLKELLPHPYDEVWQS